MLECHQEAHAAVSGTGAGPSGLGEEIKAAGRLMAGGRVQPQLHFSVLHPAAQTRRQEARR